MLEKAITKIKTEMEGDKNPYVQVIGHFLIEYLEEDPEAADKIMADDKTIAKSLTEMRKVAEKKKVGNIAVLTPQEGYEAVLKYFEILVVNELDINKLSKETKIEPVKAEEVKVEKKTDFNVSLDDFLK